MPIEIPTWPQPMEANPRFILFGGHLKAELGGPTTTVLRPGARFALDVRLPSMRLVPSAHHGLGARVFWSRLRQALRHQALYPVPQPDLLNKALGAPVVDGATAVANTEVIPIRGLVDGSVVREGQFVSVVHGGRRYLHQATEEVVTADGTMDLPVLPPLRVDLVDGDVLEFAVPKIEGILDTDALDAPVDVRRLADIQFTIEEAE